MPGGYCSFLLRINLNKGTVSTQKISEPELRKYLGGSGLAAKILFTESPAATDPWSPENLLIFMTGPLTNTPVPTSSRYSVVAISPKTGILGESSASGFWGLELKQSGYDGIILEGKSPVPVYIWINDGEVSLKDASHLWGQDTFQTDEMVRAETHPQASVVSIGLAGERGIHYACIVGDGKHARVAGRTGMGAVMGNKNVKAIATRK